MEQAIPRLLYAKSKKIWNKKRSESDFSHIYMVAILLVLKNRKDPTADTESVRDNPAVLFSGKHTEGLFA